MKKIFLLLVTSLVLALPLSAQWVFNSFESSTKDSMMTITKNSSAKKWYLLQYDTGMLCMAQKHIRHHGNCTPPKATAATTVLNLKDPVQKIHRTSRKNIVPSIETAHI